ncbi:MAG: hypothetical protein KBG83_00065 [Bacteroidetes bacterium]|nr:hypothetical protein [Bacteroidota bacterium]
MIEETIKQLQSAMNQILFKELKEPKNMNYWMLQHSLTLLQEVVFALRLYQEIEKSTVEGEINRD